MDDPMQSGSPSVFGWRIVAKLFGNCAHSLADSQSQNEMELKEKRPRKTNTVVTVCGHIVAGFVSKGKCKIRFARQHSNMYVLPELYYGQIVGLILKSNILFVIRCIWVI